MGIAYKFVAKTKLPYFMIGQLTFYFMIGQLTIQEHLSSNNVVLVLGLL